MTRTALLPVVLLMGCSVPWLQHTIQPAPPPVMRSSNRPISGLASNRVLVVSPVSIELVSPDVALQTGPPQPPAPAAATAGAMQTADYNEAVSVAEMALLNKGWRPISQAVLARVAQQEHASVRELRQGGLSWLQIALHLGRASGADTLLVIRAVDTKADPNPTLPCPDSDVRGVVSYTVTVDAALIRAETGAVDWAGNIEVTSGNLIAQPITIDRTEEVSCRMRASDPALPNFYCLRPGQSYGGEPCKRPAKLSPFIERAIVDLVTKVTLLAKGQRG